ncbi:MAG: polyprenol monophosphomannose synthase [Candidatus Eisenbacteria bacterium]|uniref:Polyprenol monophosphomannose synthase n=1 Tax=Eiseniibacteriota bacterium TaxID=2212470 RepID=A0A538TM90_UNCEI|nr:MAG: polyprenol monophosphomannose synthase [Candidatus Eisenbacteria bacterium]
MGGVAYGGATGPGRIARRGGSGGSRGQGVKALVIIPTYDERENLVELLGRVFAQNLPTDVLIVDDNSPDGTGELADELAAANPRVHVMHRAGKLGLGSAYVAGFRWALERDYEAVFEMDADFSHNPDSLGEFLRELENADLVLGSRYLHGVTVVNWPLSRLILSYSANVYSRVITGMRVKDLTGGFKCFRRSVLEAIDWSRVGSDGYAFQIEISFKAWRKGFRIKEIPIMFVDRRAGSSKMSRKIVREAVWMVWRLRLLDLLGAL